MNTVQRGLITLLRSAITTEALPLPEDFRLIDAMEQIQRHSMVTLAYAGALNCGVKKEDPAMQQLFSLYCKAIIQSECQLRELQRLYQAFDAAGIDHMPLKGSKMKALYPQPELRLMGDADILIRMEQYEDQIVPVMQKLGYVFQSESDHELVWDIRGLHVELHKHVIPSYNEDFYAYFGNGWKQARLQQPHRYSMNPEAEFVYDFAHFTKHYRDGGIGCRHVVDLMVFLRSFPELNEAAVALELDKLGLLPFYENIRNLLNAWFSDGPWDELTEFLTEYIFASGSWGLMENKLLSMSIRGFHHSKTSEKSRFRYMMNTVFLPVKALEHKYTILRSAPWMLPLVWVYRPFHKLLFERNDLKLHSRNLKIMSQENMDRHLKMLQYVGLDTNF